MDYPFIPLLDEELVPLLRGFRPGNASVSAQLSIAEVMDKYWTEYIPDLGYIKLDTHCAIEKSKDPADNKVNNISKVASSNRLIREDCIKEAAEVEMNGEKEVEPSAQTKKAKI